MRVLASIHEVPATDWNALVGDYPFLQHEFLSALEDSEATSERTGWVPHHWVIETNGMLTAALPVFLKFHSRGEYVFDWSWADAWERAGGRYYPKLLSAAPFTPATGPRFLGDPDLWPQFLDAIDREFEAGISSWHCLFPAKAPDSDALIERHGVQYHWFNHGYTTFDDYLAPMTSKRRKAIKRERRIVRDQGIAFERISGSDVQGFLLDEFYHYYQTTYAVRGQKGYLNRDTFRLLFERMGDMITLVRAVMDEQGVGVALLFHDADTLYGRYWGGINADCLHFEACYYQGIEIAIERGLKRFDPGAQGEHKIPRGFEPVQTRSLHAIADSEFRDAIARFVRSETPQVQAWQEHAATALPFKLEKPTPT